MCELCSTVQKAAEWKNSKKKGKHLKHINTRVNILNKNVVKKAGKKENQFSVIHNKRENFEVLLNCLLYLG